MGSKAKQGKALTGTIRKSEMAGGAAWELHTDGGDVYELNGGGSDLLQEGVRAEVDGDVEADQMSITMTGPILRVRNYRVL